MSYALFAPIIFFAPPPENPCICPWNNENLKATVVSLYRPSCNELVDGYCRTGKFREIAASGGSQQENFANFWLKAHWKLKSSTLVRKYWRAGIFRESPMGKSRNFLFYSIHLQMSCSLLPPLLFSFTSTAACQDIHVVISFVLRWSCRVFSYIFESKLTMLTLHCVDRIYRGTASARIDRQMPTWKQPSDGRLHTGKRTSVSQPPAYGCLTGY